MAQISESLRNVALIAGSIAIIQGAVWLTLSIFAIVSYNVCHFYEPEIVQQLFWSNIQRVYFMGPSCYHSLQSVFEQLNFNIMLPYQILIWMGFYVGLSAFWIVISSLVVTGSMARKVNVRLIAIYYMWTFLTLGITCVDIAIGLLFLRDYEIFAAYYDLHVSSGNECYLFHAAGSFTLMTIAFRGFVLILINLTLVIYLFIKAFSLQLDKTKYQHNLRDHGPIHAFESGFGRSSQPKSPRAAPAPAPAQTAALQFGQSNPAFVFSAAGNSSGYERSHSWHEIKMSQPKPRIVQEPLKTPVSKKPPQQPQPSALSPRVSEPYTPTPDYSPPAQRRLIRLKSSLKHTR